MSLKDQSIPKEVLAAADSLRSFNLIVPETVTRDKGGFATWDELCSVESAVHTEDEAVTIFQLKLKVLPGIDPEQDSPNVGKAATFFMRYNFDALRTGEPKKQVTMSEITARTLKQLAVADGLDISSGLDGVTMAAMFPGLGDMEADASILEGKKFLITFQDDSRESKQYNGRNQQNINAVAAAPEGV